MSEVRIHTWGMRTSFILQFFIAKQNERLIRSILLSLSSDTKPLFRPYLEAYKSELVFFMHKMWEIV